MVEQKTQTQKHHPKRVTGFDRELAKRIRTLREGLELPQSHMAEQLGVSTTQYQKYEKAQTRLTIQRLVNIATILDTPVTVLLGQDSGINALRDDITVLSSLLNTYHQKFERYLEY